MAGFTGQGLPENFPIEFLPGEVSQLTGHRAAAALSDPGAPPRFPVRMPPEMPFSAAELAAIGKPPFADRGDIPVTAAEAAEFDRLGRLIEGIDVNRIAAQNAARLTADRMAGVGGTSDEALSRWEGRMARRIDDLKAINKGETLQRNKPNPMLGGGAMPFYYQGANRFPTGEPIEVHHEGQSPGEKLARSMEAADIAEAQMHGVQDPVTGDVVHTSSFFRPGQIVSGVDVSGARNPLAWGNILDDVQAVSTDGRIPTELLVAIEDRDQGAITEYANKLMARNPSSETTEGKILNLFMGQKRGKAELAKGKRDTYRTLHGGMNPDKVAAARLAASREARTKTIRGKDIQANKEIKREAARQAAKYAGLNAAERMQKIRGENALALARAQGGGDQGVGQGFLQLEKDKFWIEKMEKLGGGDLAAGIIRAKEMGMAIPEHMLAEGGEELRAPRQPPTAQQAFQQAVRKAARDRGIELNPASPIPPAMSLGFDVIKENLQKFINWGNRPIF